MILVPGHFPVFIIGGQSLTAKQILPGTDEGQKI